MTKSEKVKNNKIAGGKNENKKKLRKWKKSEIIRARSQKIR